MHPFPKYKISQLKVLYNVHIMIMTSCIKSGLTVAIVAAYKTIFHLQRIWIVKDSAPIARFFAVVYVSNAPSTRLSRSYRRYCRGIKNVQIHVPSFFRDFGDQWLEILNIFIIWVYMYFLRKLRFASAFVSGNLKVHGFAQTWR